MNLIQIKKFAEHNVMTKSHEQILHIMHTREN